MPKLGNKKLGESFLGPAYEVGRGATSSFVSDLDSDRVRPVLFFRFDFDSGTKRYCTYRKDITTATEDNATSETFTGFSGLPLEVEKIRETLDETSNDLDLIFAGADSGLRSIALTEDWQGRDAAVHIGMLDSSDNLTEDPNLLKRGFIDQMTVDADPNSPKITITIADISAKTQITDPLRWRDQDQKRDHPDDKFFEFAAETRDKTISVGSTNMMIPIKGRNLLGPDHTMEDFELKPGFVRGGAIGSIRGRRKTGEVFVGQGADDARNVVYGTRRVQNALIFAELTSNGLAMVMPVGDATRNNINDVTKVWLNEKLVWDTGTFQGDFAGTINVHDGSQTSADSTLTTSSDSWTSDHIGYDVAYIMVELENNDALPTGNVRLTALVEGSVVTDGVIQSGSRFTDNAGLVLRDWLKNERYGMGVTSSAWDDGLMDDLIRESHVQFTDADGDTKRKYRINANVRSTDKKRRVLRNLTNQFAGEVSVSSGRIKINRGRKQSSSVYTDVTEDDMVGKIEVSPRAATGDRITGLKGEFTWDQNQYRMTDYQIEDSNAVSADADKNWETLDLPYAVDDHRVRRIAETRLAQRRQQITGAYVAGARLWDAVPGSIIEMDNSFLSWTGKKLLITEVKIDVDPRKGIRLFHSFREIDQSAEFQFTADDISDTPSDSGNARSGGGGPRSVLRQVKIDLTALAPDGDSGSIAKSSRVEKLTKSDEITVRELGVMDEGQNQDADLFVQVYDETNGALIAETNNKFDSADVNYDKDNDVDVSFRINNQNANNRKSATGFVFYEIVQR